jgi:putative aldouronate transport system permease protein
MTLSDEYVARDKGIARRGLLSRPGEFGQVLLRDFRRNKYIYLMLLPVVAYYLLFHYIPMWGAQIAFRDFDPALGINGSPWVGLENFKEFFSSFYFDRLFRNTILLNVWDLILGFPAPIILALLLNELKFNPFKRAVQTVSYLPHFISLVVVVGMMVDFLARDGLVNQILGTLFGMQPIAFMQQPQWFRPLYVLSGIWQGIGWSSIIYLAAISAIDPSLYEAAMVDGAGRFRQIWHITLAGIMPTIVLLLILRIGFMMTVGYEKIILMYNPLTFSTADVFSTYVYRKGILEMNYSFSAAVGLFSSGINFVLLIAANTISRRVNGSGLW